MRKWAVLALSLMASPVLATGLKIDIEGKANGSVEIDLFENVP